MFLFGALWVPCCDGLGMPGALRPVNVAFALLIFILVFIVNNRLKTKPATF
jgi:hypothetical protein